MNKHNNKWLMAGRWRFYETETNRNHYSTVMLAQEISKEDRFNYGNQMREHDSREKERNK